MKVGIGSDIPGYIFFLYSVRENIVKSLVFELRQVLLFPICSWLSPAGEPSSGPWPWQLPLIRGYKAEYGPALPNQEEVSKA